MVKITTPTSNIDYQYTLMTFVAHPFENEITVKDDAKINIVSIETYYEST